MVISTPVAASIDTLNKTTSETAAKRWGLEEEADVVVKLSTDANKASNSAKGKGVSTAIQELLKNEGAAATAEATTAAVGGSPSSQLPERLSKNDIHNGGSGANRRHQRCATTNCVHLSGSVEPGLDDQLNGRYYRLNLELCSRCSVRIGE